ncbi:hypothetical protein [Nevskia sp.]|uniref:hypothetical protein n=1 Tax=Nevskia sp. TaxID=1929292 RepID=UPI0025DD50DE|nr:hypothetical protein [Nevskia sp.]
MSHSPDNHDTAVTQDPAIRRAVTALKQWEDDVDTVQRAHLAAARRRALSPEQATAWPVWAGGAVAASLALVIGVSLWPAMQRGPSSARPTDAASLAAPVVAEYVADFGDADDELLHEGLDSDLELYLWLDGTDAA